MANSSAIQLPPYLYDLKDSLRIGGPIRAYGYLIRLRAENLVAREDGELGLRRATHAAALVEMLYRANNPGSPGFFTKDLKRQLFKRLEESDANLQRHEQRFASAEWWEGLDKDTARHEARSNIARLIDGEITVCTIIGMQIHMTFDLMMLHAMGPSKYESIFLPELRADQGFTESLGALAGTIAFAAA